MTCAQARDRLLEAEPDELAGAADSALAAHIRDCARCAAAADRLIDATTTLAAELGSVRPRWTADEALDRALGEADVVRVAPGAARSGAPTTAGPSTHWARGPLAADQASAPSMDRSASGAGQGRTAARWRRAAAVVLPLAAAAGLAVALLTGQEPPPPKPLPIARLASARPTPAVSLPAGRSAAVFKTSNPKITVVWFY